LAAYVDGEGKLTRMAIEPVLTQPEPLRRDVDREELVRIAARPPANAWASRGACSVVNCRSRARAASGASSRSVRMRREIGQCRQCSHQKPSRSAPESHRRAARKPHREGQTRWPLDRDPMGRVRPKPVKG